MEIVIKIDADLYTRLFDNGEEYAADMRRACVAIRRGVVLPKGHGDLIDKKEVYKKLYCRCLARVAKEVLEETPTIIEADKAGEEE